MVLSFLIMTSSISVNVPCVFCQDVDDLIYMTKDYPPWNFKENGEIKGISPDLLRLMWEKMRYSEQPIKLLSWARGYMLVQKNKNHVLMTMVRTEDDHSRYSQAIKDFPVGCEQIFIAGLKHSGKQQT